MHTYKTFVKTMFVKKKVRYRGSSEKETSIERLELIAMLLSVFVINFNQEFENSILLHSKTIH